MAFKEVDHHRKGLRIELFYDPNVIEIRYNKEDGMNSDTSVVVRLINKQLLKHIGTYEKPLLRLAFLQNTSQYMMREFVQFLYNQKEGIIIFLYKVNANTQINNNKKEKI